MTSRSLEKRIEYHLKSAEMGSDLHFHRAIRKYGIDDFKKEILEECNDLFLLKEREIFWIEKFNSFENGYNMTSGGDGKLGYKTSEDTKKKISETHINSGSAKLAYQKRNDTLLKKDPSFLKNIGEKSSLTQRINGKNKGKNNPNFRKDNILLINEKGEVVRSFLFSELENNMDLPIRAIVECLKTNKPMYTWNKTDSKYSKWIACYENKIFCSLETKFKKKKAK